MKKILAYLAVYENGKTAKAWYFAVIWTKGQVGIIWKIVWLIASSAFSVARIL
jgi:hypothetical protein